jgi:predicted transcriptional regulator
MTTSLVTTQTHQENIKYLQAMTEQEILDEIFEQEKRIVETKRLLREYNQTSSNGLLFNEYHLETMKSVSKTYRRQEILTQLGL